MVLWKMPCTRAWKFPLLETQVQTGVSKKYAKNGTQMRILGIGGGTTAFVLSYLAYLFLFIYLFFVSGIKAHSQTTYNILHSQDEKIRKTTLHMQNKQTTIYIKVIDL